MSAFILFVALTMADGTVIQWEPRIYDTARECYIAQRYVETQMAEYDIDVSTECREYVGV